MMDIATEKTFKLEQPLLLLSTLTGESVFVVLDCVRKLDIDHRVLSYFVCA